MTTLTVAVFLVLSLAPPLASSDHIYPYDPVEHSYLEEVTSWRHADGKGDDLFFNRSKDCSRLVLIGYAGPNDVRVTDQDLVTLAILEPPEEPFEAKGAKWSKTNRWVAVWGRVAGADRDVLTIYDGTTLKPADNVPWCDLIDIPAIDSLCFFADDYILMVGGRDEQGKSVLCHLETFNNDLRSVREWPGNHTILHMGEDSRHIMLVDSGGTITHYDGKNWVLLEDFGGVLGTPTAWFVHWTYPWAFGDAEGLTAIAYHLPYHAEFNITAEEGPVQGISQSLDRVSDVFIATARPGGGSKLSAWQLFNEANDTDVQQLDSLDLDSNITLMEPIGGGPGRVLVAFENGTLAVFRLNIRPLPLGIGYGMPDQEDGFGLETIALWRHPLGEVEGLKFAFNHGGSLIALHAFSDPPSIYIVNRSFETLRVINLPEGHILSGYKWSSTDSWLAVTGLNTTSGVHWLDIYDVPSFTKNISLEIDWIMEHIMAIDAMEFLEGDRVLAVSGTGYNSTSKLWFFDLRNRTVIREHELNYTLYYPYEAVEVVGDSLVCLSKSGWYATISLENYNLTSTGTGPFEEWAHFDQYEDEWMFIHGHYNLSYYGESLGNQAWTWSDQCPYLNELTWTHVEKGDVVLAVSNRPEGGHQLHLWRDVDEQGREGMRLVSVLNISRKVYMMEADPAYPGIVAVSTTDGYFALYHVNVSGYPPAPTEIGNVPINGTIDWPVVDNNGNGGNDTNNTNTTGDGSQDAWGSSPPGLLVAGLLVAIIALLVTFVWLRRMGPRS